MHDVAPTSFTVSTARPDELEPAFQLIFAKFGGADRRLRASNAVEMTRQGALDPSGVLVARRGRDLIGAMIVVAAAGACGLVWPPAVMRVLGKNTAEDKLVRQATAWLRKRGAKFAQALILPGEGHQAEALLRNGFTHITDLTYMRHDLAAAANLSGRRLRYQDFAIGNQALFLDTLQRTYEDAPDCPEINDVRTMDEIIAGHKAQGKFDPARWWLALHGGVPVGVLLLTEFADAPIWDLTYVGIVPEFRRQGLGRELALKAIDAARSAGALELTLAVDARNRPAIELYRALGFEGTEQRHVYLAIWPTGRPT